MKFAFVRRVTVEEPVVIEADTEQAAWTLALAGDPGSMTVGDGRALRKPIYTRKPDRDEYDL